jgi:putative acetyltransferase
MAVVVRPVESRDVEAVIELVRAVLAEFGLQFGVDSPTDDAVRGLPASFVAHGGAFWIAEQREASPTGDGGAVIGTCGMFPVGPNVYELRKMYLAPAARGLGVGRELLATAVAWARARDAKRVVLDTIEAMTRAIAFYEAHGFVRDDAEIRGSRCTRGYALEL